MQRTFAKLDVDSSGYIDADELVSWMIWCLLLACLAMQESWPSTCRRLFLEKPYYNGMQQSVGLTDANWLPADKGAAQAVDVCECRGQPAHDRHVGRQ